MQAAKPQAFAHEVGTDEEFYDVGLTCVPRPVLIKTEQVGTAFPGEYRGPAKLPTNP